MTNVIRRKKFGEPKRVNISLDIEEIWIDVSRPRTIPCFSQNKGKPITRHLLITEKGKLTLP